jgi:hypothetical protein
MKPGITCYNAVTIKIKRIVILTVVLYECESRSFTMREERRLKVFKNRVVKRIIGLKRDEVAGNGENYITKSLMTCIPYHILG